ncbi:class III signal peptide-containing protein [Methanocaldococcus indicus]|uniref:class III signal peptide-containing protein n=1 Tax=Methanocaldococcus indicus TaxID=213231 RepID=UPI003C6CF46E
MRGQLSLEFAIIFLGILVLSIVTIYNFLNITLFPNDSLSTIDIEKISSTARTAINLVNSGYRGFNETVYYVGITYEGYNVTVYITPNVSEDVKNFIVSYIKNNSNINKNYSLIIAAY